MFSLIIDIENCTANINAGEYDTGNFLFSVVANSEYDFLNSTPHLHIRTNKGSYSDIELIQINKTTCNLEYAVSANIESVTIIAYATKSTPIKDKYGFISVFAPSIENLKVIASKRFIKFSTSGSQYIDTAQYLIALFRIYCNVNTSESERVYFGKYDMGVNCPIVTNDILILDCGNVTISEYYHNSIDYNDTEIKLYLPFVGFIDLSINDVMNKTINLKYQVNVINGDSLAIISAGNNEILTQNCNISYKIPYTMEESKKVYSEVETNNNYLNSLQPFLYIKRSIMNDNNITPFNKTSTYDFLRNFSGYTEILNLEYNITSNYITNTEIDIIKQLVASGVIL